MFFLKIVSSVKKEFSIAVGTNVNGSPKASEDLIKKSAAFGSPLTILGTST